MHEIIRFGDVADRLQVGISQVECDSLGISTFVGWSKEGDAILQGEDSDFTTIPELTWNMMKFGVVFEPETHVRYITEDVLIKLHDDCENFLQTTLASTSNVIYKYEATIHIKKVREV